MTEDDVLSRFSEEISRRPAAVNAGLLVLILLFYYLGLTVEAKKDIYCPMHEKFAIANCEGGEAWNLKEITQENMPHEPGAKEIIRCSWRIKKFWGTRVWVLDPPVCSPHTMFF